MRGADGLWEETGAKPSADCGCQLGWWRRFTQRCIINPIRHSNPNDHVRKHAGSHTQTVRTILQAQNICDEMQRNSSTELASAFFKYYKSYCHLMFPSVFVAFLQERQSFLFFMKSNKLQLWITKIQALRQTHKSFSFPPAQSLNRLHIIRDDKTPQNRF